MSHWKVIDGQGDVTAIYRTRSEAQEHCPSGGRVQAVQSIKKACRQLEADEVVAPPTPHANGITSQSD
jgi:hypothetical protein